MWSKYCQKPSEIGPKSMKIGSGGVWGACLRASCAQNPTGGNPYRPLSDLSGEKCGPKGCFWDQSGTERFPRESRKLKSRFLVRKCRRKGRF